MPVICAFEMKAYPEPNNTVNRTVGSDIISRLSSHEVGDHHKKRKPHRTHMYSNSTNNNSPLTVVWAYRGADPIAAENHGGIFTKHKNAHKTTWPSNRVVVLRRRARPLRVRRFDWNRLCDLNKLSVFVDRLQISACADMNQLLEIYRDRIRSVEEPQPLHQLLRADTAVVATEFTSFRMLRSFHPRLRRRRNKAVKMILRSSCDVGLTDTILLLNMEESTRRRRLVVSPKTDLRELVG